MSYLRFNHVFLGLMLLSFLSAFVIAPHITDRARAQVQNIFVPVAWPVNRIGGWAHAKLSPEAGRDDASPSHPRSSAELLRENLELRELVASLSGQVRRLQEREAELGKLGDVRSMCTVFSVAGADSGQRESLMLGGSSFDGLKVGMPVLHTGGIAGRISRAGVGGAQVQLVTDIGFKPFTVKFVRFTRKPNGSMAFQALSADSFLIRGIGNGALAVERMTYDKAKEMDLKLNDWVVLSDRDWPLALDSYRIGTVVSIEPARDPGFVDVRVSPSPTLISLREVMVMNK